ncbi:MAG TPA: UDP-N-acetylmuramoyl-L-alanyl-D-glutamate--2,6-diaminopimelate ligase [Motilibacteraceae bacterium]|nr:UDP-N-acetylmuramoyl-L-alanyl-D-glutamate--2,6-diaminopimelate ligase [Motilibacteraceae bacterium]
MPSPAGRPAALRPREVPGRTLADVCARLGLPAPVQPGETAPAQILVTGVTHDSRAVQPGDLYAALPGSRAHGADFAADVVALGAVAVLTDPAGQQRAAACGLPVLVVEDPRHRLGALAAWVYGEPAADLLLVGTTGTNGKTTTSYLLEACLAAAGRRTGLIGTVETRIGEERVASVRTTPESTDLQALLAVMRERGADAVAMEVSSHALVLGRVDGLVFDVALFTNLSQDHLDFHGTLENYFQAKASLFTPGRSRVGVVDVDDAYGARLAREASVPVVTVSPSGEADAHWRVVERAVEAEGARTRFTLAHRDGRRIDAVAPLPGDFNVANTALAVVACAVADVDVEAAVRGLEDFAGVPGRLERVGDRADGPLALVDYAHTPDAVDTVLRTLRPVVAGRLAVVLGAGGDRDRDKRPGMGAAAARWADLVIVTDDNPRSEDPATVRAAVLAGAREQAARSGARVLDIADRREAVRTAVRGLGPGDAVVVAGKGHEQGQDVGGVVHPFDDRTVLRAALDESAAGHGGPAADPAPEVAR